MAAGPVLSYDRRVCPGSSPAPTPVFRSVVQSEAPLAKPHQELIAKEGWLYLWPPAVLAALSLIFGGPLWLTVLAAVLAVYVGWFFRNPYRQIPEDPDVIVSPADGKVVAVRELEDGRRLVAIFLNIFNVHVNRSPIAGAVDSIEYAKGRFVSAYKDEASEVNERNRLTIRDGDFVVEVVQIAGLIARRIVCWARESQALAKGERFGLIKFGSRVDVILPANSEILVTEGQKVAGGSHALARRG